jgi:hypothetical protein
VDFTKHRMGKAVVAPSSKFARVSTSSLVRLSVSLSFKKKEEEKTDILIAQPGRALALKAGEKAAINSDERPINRIMPANSTNAATMVCQPSGTIAFTIVCKPGRTREPLFLLRAATTFVGHMPG